MQSAETSPEKYLDSLPEARKEAMEKLRLTINDNLPNGFSEVMNYGTIGYVVPHSLYPAGYHCDPKLSLPFIGIASQKNFIALYHMGLYANQDLLEWFVSEYTQQTNKKTDMGKSCIRFKKPEAIPYDLIVKLVSKISPKQWIEIYEG